MDSILQGKRIVLGITGSIAAYKAASLIRLFIKKGTEVQVVITPAGKEFITPLTLSALTGKPVISDFFSQRDGTWHSHVALGEWADLMLIAPATASTIGKMAHGIADNMLITTYLSMKAPVFIAPAMDLDMFAHPSTQENLRILQGYGNHLIEPAEGELASHLVGKGRMEEPEKILSVVEEYLENGQTLLKKKIVITAGPTYEKIDPVRFIGNYSSGKMGFALAEECAQQGAEVTLVAGPVQLRTVHPLIKRVDVESAAEMYQATTEVFKEADAAILCAAVADFTPVTVASQKIKREKDDLQLTLQPTQDIAAALGKVKTSRQRLVGFALETTDETAHAQEKLKRKNLDFIVLNSLNDAGAGFRHDTNKISILTPEGKEDFPLKSKKAVATDIVKKLAALLTCLLFLLVPFQGVQAQELNANVVVNSSKIQGTNNQVFETLKTAITEFLNTRKWTNSQYGTQEKIACSFNLIVNEYSDAGSFSCDLIVQSNRPVFNASYTTTVFNFKDTEVSFNYVEFDKLEYQDEVIDNNLTAVLAYYAYLLIGLDMDTFAPQGGTEVLRKAENVVNNAQMLSEGGWKAFDRDKNRHALINDYMNGAMEPYRQLLYDYHRKGLDEMVQNAERGRSNITASMALLKKAKADKPMSILPQLFSEIKKEELLNIYTKGTTKEKEEVYTILCDVNPSLTNDWEEIKKPSN